MAINLKYNQVKKEATCYGCGNSLNNTLHHEIIYTLSAGLKPISNKVYTHSNSGCLTKANERIDVEKGEMLEKKVSVKNLHLFEIND
ncbi:MAG TPA: hypothetical protein P5277_00855 [Candidatus Paceibacterota bacterium]|nr:hypothetical protein [Candidatus Paceibacterota bacterium]